MSGKTERILMLVAVDVDPEAWVRKNALRERQGRAATTPAHDVECAATQSLQHLDGVVKTSVMVVPE